MKQQSVRVCEPIRLAVTVRQRLRGLLRTEPKAGDWLIAPCCDIHTFGMGRVIDVAFVDADGVVIEVHRKVGAYRRLRNSAAAGVIERFASEESWFEQGDVLGLVPLNRPSMHVMRAARHRRVETVKLVPQHRAGSSR